MVCGVKSLISSMKTPTPAEGKVVVFTISGRLSTKRALYGKEAWREPWLTWLVMSFFVDILFVMYIILFCN